MGSPVAAAVDQEGVARKAVAAVAVAMAAPTTLAPSASYAGRRGTW